MLRNLSSLAVSAWMGSATVSALAQALPPPASSVCKCVVDGKTVYSDQPCLGAARVDVTPTRGVNKTTGRVRIGKDVRDENHAEALGRALQPLTGQDVEHWKKNRRRAGLPASDRQRCHKLDGEIEAAEAAETRATRGRLGAVQQKLLKLRKTHFELRC